MPQALLIEDTLSNQHLASFLLKRVGCDVTLAANGEEGVACARAARPDVIVLDIEMPVMDGYETLAILKQDSSTKDVPVMVATSYAMPGERQKATDLGADVYLEKPFDPEVFMAKIRDLLTPAP
jgi:two-component system cell cycle response regulator DivK